MKPPRSKGARFLRLAGMTTSVAARYAGSRVASLFGGRDEAAGILAQAHLESGRRIAKTLGELKGAVMKVGQMASIGTDWLPPELAEPLKALQKQAPPVDFEVIAAQVEAELGAAPPELFDRFDEEPFASASIGQVHRARTEDGREVVVKVQYPGVEASVDSDLAQLRVALGAAGLVRLPRAVMRELFRELRRQLHEELDYANEAANVRLFREIHAGDELVAIPDVVEERSSARVLTLTYEPGELLGEITPARHDQPFRDRVGWSLCRMIVAQVFEHGVLHADPNPANFGVRPDGTLVVYDFGCIKRLRPEIVEGYRAIVRAYLVEDYDGLDRGMAAIGARNPDGPDVDAEVYRTFRPIFLPVFDRERPFDYGASRMQAEVLGLAPRMRHLAGAFQPPVEGVLVNRVVAGHYGNLHRLGVRLRIMDLLAPHLEQRDGQER